MLGDVDNDGEGDLIRFTHEANLASAPRPSMSRALRSG